VRNPTAVTLIVLLIVIIGATVTQLLLAGR
jgi:hypothetical protein